MQFVIAGEEPEGALITEAGELRIYVEQENVDNLKGAKIDFIPATGSFDIDNPNPPFAWDDPLAQQVQDVLTGQINPSVAQHGGWVTLLDVKDEVAYIELGGGCVGCGMVDVTLKQGVEVAIKASVPEIASVVDTTDHASGTNPYFQQSKNDPHHQPAKGGQAPSSPFA
jgi:Fe/S biogenesis protein NfuA